MRSLLTLFCALFLVTAHAGVTKWVDAQGKVHYGDRPPVSGGSSAELRGTVSIGEGITVIPAAKSAGEIRTAAVVAPRAGEIWIYTTQRCGYCTRAKKHMNRKGVRFFEKDVDAHPQYEAEFRALGGRGVPVTLAGQRRINGYREESFDAFLKSIGL